MSQDPDVIARRRSSSRASIHERGRDVSWPGAALIGQEPDRARLQGLTRRIAWMLTELRAWPSQILAITFTNKAAGRCANVLERLIGPAARRMWVSTFHSACVRILRRDEVHRAGVGLLDL